MKVFICWSGPTSKRLAEIFRDWIPAVIQAIKPYFSPEDVEKGARWYPEISKELEQCMAGIICLTRENLVAPWIMFEAGALSKNVEKSRLVPLLFGIDAADIKGPLIQFQAAPFSEEEIKKLLKGLNSALDDAGLEEPILDSVFEKWWPELKASIQEVLKEEEQQKRVVQRNDRDLLEELLGLTRAMYYNRDTIYYQSIDILRLSAIARKSLKELNVSYMYELVQLLEQDLLRKHFSREIINEIKEKLQEHGLHLAMKIK